MEDFIISETTKTFNKAIKRFGKNEKINPMDVSLLLYLKDEDDDRKVGYKICHYHQPQSDTTIMEILGVMIDFKRFSIIVPPQIRKIIENFEADYQSKNIEVCVYLDREEDDEVIYFLYNDGALVKKFALQDVLKLEMA